MKFKHLLFSAVAVGALTFSAASYADSIAYVNMQEIMHDSSAAKSVKEQIDAKTKQFQEEMSKKEEELQKEDQDLSKQHSVLAPDVFDKKVKDFRSKATEVQKDAQTKRMELDDAIQSSQMEIDKTLFGIVKKMAKEKGYSVVLPTSGMLYADPKLDITPEVLSKLNASLPKMTVKFRAVSASGSKDEE